MCFILAVLVGVVFDGDVQETELNIVRTVEDHNAFFEVVGWVERETVTKGERPGRYGEKAYLTVVRKEGGVRLESRIDRAVGIDAVVMTGNEQFVTLTETHNGYGHRVTRWEISDSLAPKELEFVRCYWPYLAPNRKWVFYKAWYTRTGMPERPMPMSTWMVDITQSPLVPVLVYPPDNPSGRDADGRIHVALTSSSTLLWTEDCRRLYYFEFLRPENNRIGLEGFLIEVQISDPLSIEKAIVHKIDVSKFLKPGVDATDLAFSPMEIHWAGDGIISGTLKSKPEWKSRTFYMTTDGKYLDPESVE